MISDGSGKWEVGSGKWGSGEVGMNYGVGKWGSGEVGSGGETIHNWVFKVRLGVNHTK
ncbi:hypothetical protein [Microcystis aeruginosa]|uniref:hypothetical protein n=1 Tax=Microcystis aeruginosa TaxID=1126 RepID=UPI0002F6E797|nr:hypothetical protein [Microcystis aeruginosa]